MPQLMTAQWVDRLKAPEDARVEYFDEKVPGLILRVTSKGKKSWYVLYRVKGDNTRRRTGLGDYPGLTLADAREKAKEILVLASRGQDSGAQKQETRKAPTFGELAELYIEKYAKPQKRTWERDQELLARNVLPHWKRLKAHDLKRRDVIILLDAIVDRGAPIPANRTLAVIRKLFNWAISRDLVENNPCLQVKAPAKENERDRVLDNNEIRALWKAFDILTPEMRAIFQIRFVTAQRGAEVSSMIWSDINWEEGWWTIPARIAKNGLSHRVPLTPAYSGEFGH